MREPQNKVVPPYEIQPASVEEQIVWDDLTHVGMRARAKMDALVPRVRFHLGSLATMRAVYKSESDRGSRFTRVWLKRASNSYTAPISLYVDRVNLTTSSVQTIGPAQVLACLSRPGRLIGEQFQEYSPSQQINIISQAEDAIGILEIQQLAARARGAPVSYHD